MKNFWRKLARVFVSSSATAAAVSTTSGDPITSGNVLIPAAVAGVIAAIHSVLPEGSSGGPQDPPTSIRTPPR